MYTRNSNLVLFWHLDTCTWRHISNWEHITCSFEHVPAHKILPGTTSQKDLAGPTYGWNVPGNIPCAGTCRWSSLDKWLVARLACCLVRGRAPIRRACWRMNSFGLSWYLLMHQLFGPAFIDASIIRPCVYWCIDYSALQVLMHRLFGPAGIDASIIWPCGYRCIDYLALRVSMY